MPLRALPQAMNDYQAAKHLEAAPGPLQFLGYIFCLGNLLAGPYLEFRDYLEFVEHRGVRGPGRITFLGNMLAGRSSELKSVWWLY
jgi:lysophospholipid acyltransferase